MSQKDLRKELNAAALSSNAIVAREEPPVFHRCTCPECGEDAMELCGHGVFFRSDFLGVTHDAEFGCGEMVLDGEYHWIIACGSCGYEAFNTDVLPNDTLVDWVASHGQAMRCWNSTVPSADLHI